MAAGTIATPNARQPFTQLKGSTTGAGRMIFATFTPTNSYSSGGDGCDFAAFSNLIGGTGAKAPAYVFVQPSAGYIAEWVPSTKKMKVYRQSAATSALTEPTGVDLSAVVFNCLLFV